MTDEDHYFYTYTSEELYEVIQRKDEWNDFDIEMAFKLLKRRGQDVSEKRLAELNEIRNKELAEPDSLWKYYLITGYLCALMGGFLGIIIGFSLYNSKKEIPNGTKVFRFSPENRKHGLSIIILAIVSFIIWGILMLN
jgi:hypothetical protein